MLWLTALPQAQAQAQRYAVEFRGAGDLTGLLNEHVDMRRRQQDTVVTQEELQRLAGTAEAQIRSLLATEGYFSPSVAHQILPQDGNWLARFDIALGAPTVVDGVALRFLGELAEGPHANARRINRLKRQWPMERGTRFRQEDWTQAKNGLLRDLLNRGFPAARISDSQALIDPEKRSAQLSVEVDAGPLFTFGSLQINGLQRYSRERIENLNPIEPGEIYSQEKLTELQIRLQDSGYFRSAFATVDVDPANPRQVPVRVELTEAERRRLGLGVGFSTDAGPHAQIKWLDRSFLGRDWRLESDLRVDRKMRILGGNLYFPMRDSGWTPSIGSRFERSDIEGEVNDKLRTDLRLSSADKANEKTWALSYLGDRQRIGDVFINNRQALMLSYIFTRRRVDNLLRPRQGYVASIELGVGPRGLINEANIGRAVARGNLLTPLVRRSLHSVVRGQVGQVVGAGREIVPADLLFRTGGDQSVRGYAYNSLGVPERGAVVGGTVMAVLSAELVYELTPTWGAALFHDAGNAADSWRDFRFRHGTGIGARWRSPIGPVNLDLAYGHATRAPRLHFSVGYGF